MILCIETATNTCSVALCDSHGMLGIKESTEERSHASMLTVFIRELMAEQSIDASQLNAVAISLGPGSYTGLRIGVSVAKGMAYALNIPVVAVNTLESMYWSVKDLPSANTTDLFCPMIDARRLEVYSALFNRDGNIVRETGAHVIDAQHLEKELENNRILIFGNGADKCRDIIKNPNASFLDEYSISASSMYLPAMKAFNEGKFEEVAYFEPFYLKDFIATIPRKKIL